MESVITAQNRPQIPHVNIIATESGRPFKSLSQVILTQDCKPCLLIKLIVMIHLCCSDYTKFINIKLKGHDTIEVIWLLYGNMILTQLHHESMTNELNKFYAVA